MGAAIITLMREMSEPKYGLMVLSCPSGASVRLVQSTVVVLY